MKVRNAPQASSVRQMSQIFLFVEGTNQSSIDKRVIEKIVPDYIRVEGIGSCYNFKGAAYAFHKFHREYCFIVDRDYRDSGYVSGLWRNFSNIDKPGLLIWKKREIENYFLDSKL